ncbi:protein MgtS [Cronobacter malonaticus]|uniref:Protein MgtS n=1 Tax=Cronobacter universalis NCTC 9529 TaxID=1074000 RepID=A0ABY1W344_9ENTR|nr:MULTISPECIES: protein MgtS [Cronobacter]ELY3466520.1 protein MgtS [Cronobacter universalis]EKP4390149.1 protein MgtS [Cronobacter malonaticus]EKY3232716.1 protein MgtS [Cronobacter malonaticus]ELQ6046046.1 protein MgtS [Cronobacter malonaticus]ELQ6066000.1 protein MgtS [Cronobacter malonaticus]
MPGAADLFICMPGIVLLVGFLAAYCSNKWDD